MNGKRAVIPVTTIAIIALIISMIPTASPEPTDGRTIHLREGWNLISFPGASENDTPDNLFENVGYAIFYLDPEWGFLPPPSDEPVQDNLGYWVKLDNAKTVTTSGYPQGPQGPRGYGMATFVVAAHDSLDNENADFVCDGTDDQVEIQAAIDNLLAIGGSIYLREGTYIVSGDIKISKSNVTLVGAGASTVIKIRDSHDANINVIYASGKSGLLIQNLRIDGNKANQTSGTMFGIYFTSVENSKIIDCWVEDLRNNGINLESSSNNTVMCNTCQGNGDHGIRLCSSSNNNTITSNTCQGNSHEGIRLDSSNNNNTVTGNNCQGNGDHGIYLYLSNNNNTVTCNTCQGNGDEGIRLDSSSNNTVTGNTCQGNSYSGIDLYNSSNNTVTGNTCQGNQISYGIYLYSSSNNTVTGNNCQGNDEGIYLERSSNNTVTGNNCQGNDVRGIRLYRSDNNIIRSNTCQRNKRSGIILDTSNNNTVSGNTVVGNSQLANNTYDGILIHWDSDYNNIQGNTVRRGTGANQQRYGIRINTVTGDNNLVINNDLYQAGVTADYGDAGTGTIYHNNRTSAGWVP